ncbi:MAG: AzlC family ABC transporter permease [Corynebacterium flavescens]|uniref:AzlC family ABC transporter permease n=1 Tax=Corynebacterium flavescens TaxID=28028 RepID=UPI0026488500|nr:AzlC family ABC transporter permease [Corynebacterium flavescens]MDN6225896.1 AzlC family ABC transporter permease [Corynebacterium flavescens]MDN6552399.1 AzlC family ABC transporter permease [Corynebacterium flavescens]
MLQEVRKGLQDAWLLALGVVPLGIAFGILLVQSGFEWWWAPVFSFVIYAGSMEFLAITMVTGGTSALASALTGFMVNFRHVFYGLTFPRQQIKNRLGGAYSTYALTDEAYAIVSALPRGDVPSGTRLLTIQVFCQSLWVGGGLIGALAGQIIPPSVQGLDFALVALFVVLAIDCFQNNRDFSLPVSAAIFGILAGVLFPQQLLVVALSAYFLLLLLRYLSPRLDKALSWRLSPVSRVVAEDSSTGCIHSQGGEG